MNIRNLWLLTALAAALAGCGGDRDMTAQLEQHAKPSLVSKTAVTMPQDSADKLPLVEKLAEDIGALAGLPQVAFNNAGDGIAVWSRSKIGGGNAYSVVARRYAKAAGTWGPLEQVSDSTIGDTDPQITTDARGNFFVVWKRGIFGVSHVVARRFDKALQKWGDIQAVSTAPVFNVIDLHVAGDRFGRMTVAWTRVVPGFGKPHELRANRFDPSSGQWKPQDELVMEFADDYFPKTQLAVDPLGNAVLMVPREGEFLETKIEMLRSVAGGGWSATESIGSVQQSSYYDCASLGVDRLGRFVAVWRDRGAGRVWSRQLVSMAADWSSPVAVSNNADPISSPALAVEPSGDIMAMWFNSSVGGGAQVMMMSSRFSSASGTWSTPQSIPGGLNARSPQLATFKSRGGSSVLAIWGDPGLGSQDLDRLVVSRFDTSLGQWAAPEAFHSHPKLYSGSALVAVSPTGNGAAVWAQIDGTSYTIATQVIQ